MPRGHYHHLPSAPCAGCGHVRGGKVYVRVGLNQSAAFCPDCLPAARQAAQERFHRNGRRLARAIWLASRRGLAA